MHDEATSADDTDWPQILALYEVLERVSPGPVVTLNRAVAVAMVHGPRAGLALLGTLDADERMAHTHRLEAVRGHLLELAGDIVFVLGAEREGLPPEVLARCDVQATIPQDGESLNVAMAGTIALYERSRRPA